MNPSRLATIVLLVALMPALPCVAQHAGAPMPGATHNGQFGPGFPQIPMTPSTISPGRQETPEAIPAHYDDDHGCPIGSSAARLGNRSRFGTATALRHCDCRWAISEPIVDAVYDARRLSLPRSCQTPLRAPACGPGSKTYKIRCVSRSIVPRSIKVRRLSSLFHYLTAPLPLS